MATAQQLPTPPSTAAPDLEQAAALSGERGAQRAPDQGRGAISHLDFSRPSVRVGYCAVIVLLAAGTVVMIFPLIWMLLGALKSANEVFRIPPTLLPESWHWENFAQGWAQLNVPRYLFNTLKILVGTWLMAITVPALAAYSLSKLRPAGARLIQLGFMATLMMPPQAYLIPRFLVLQNVPLLHINLLDTYWALWLPAGVQAFNILLLRNFFDKIPGELLDSARIDGASELRIFGQIILPLSRPILAVLSIFTFTAVWNDFFWPLIVISSQPKQPIMVAIQLFASGNGAWNVVMAVLFMATLPPILFFLIFQRHIIGGITLGSVKG